MTLKSYGNNNKAWTWTANDFSDPEVGSQQEIFAVRFKAEESAKEFHDKFTEAAIISSVCKPETGKIHL